MPKLIAQTKSPILHKLDALWSSNTAEWATDPADFACLNKKYGPFEWDVCATEHNAKTPKFIDPITDGLACDWSAMGITSGWCNPPYGRAYNEIKLAKDFPALYRQCLKPNKKGVLVFSGKVLRETHPHLEIAYRSFMALWIEKIYNASVHGRFGMLIPARTDIAAWHKYIWNSEVNAPREGVTIDFLKGRKKFGGSADAAPFPSAFVVFDRQHVSLPLP